MTQEQIEKLVDEANARAGGDASLSRGDFAEPDESPKSLLTLGAQIFEEADVSGTGSLSYSEYMTAVVNHPILVQFITGGGSVRA